MATSWFCDGVKRRDFLRVGALGGAGLALSNYLGLAEARALAGESKGKSAIFINLAGGPTHLDTFDMKPDASDEYRGQYKPIKTNVAGIEFCELMPKLAACADKFAIVRGVSHTLAAHEFGAKYLSTGNRPLASLLFPGYGCVVSKEMKTAKDLPPFVAIPNTPESAGFLGVEFAPLNTTNTPVAGQPYRVRGIDLRSLKISDIERRERLLSDLDRTFARIEKQSELLSGLDRFSQQAYDIISSKRAREAFDTSKESKPIADLFGSDPFNQSCLLAQRLIEAGVRFVTVNFGGWDMHQRIFDNLKQRLPQFDQGYAGLLTALERKGLLASTPVFVTGEFGRTPKINTQRGGRDHWPRNMFVLLAGGGFKGGQVLGKSDDKGEAPAEKGYAPDDVAASFYSSLGIDFTKEYHTSTGRPVMIVREGKVIKELFG